MNTRVQVEHTVTEAVTGHRHRARADPGRGGRAALGRRRTTSCFAATPSSAGSTPRTCRADSSRRRGGSRPIGSLRASACAWTPGVRAGDEISDLYDPMIAKLVVHDVDREHARRRMLRALEEFVIEGPTTLLGFHRALLETPCFVEGGTCRRRRGVRGARRTARRSSSSCRIGERRSAAAADGRPAAAAREQVVSVEIDGRRHEVRLARRRAAVGGARAAAPGAQQGPGGDGDRRRHEPDAGHRALGRRGATATRSRPASSSASSRR